MAFAFSTGCGLALLVSLPFDGLPWFLIVTMLYFATTMSYSCSSRSGHSGRDVHRGRLRMRAAGAVAIRSISAWLLVCTVFLSLFLGFNKRRGELVS